MKSSTNHRPGGYADISVSDDDIKNESYKRHFGGGKEKWEGRGAFQLFLLKEMGMCPNDKLLDVGCGPLRAGVHLINYLEPYKYNGVDYNRDFIKIGQGLLSADSSLSSKHAKLKVVEDFAFDQIEEHFNYVLAFSVLNHCPPQKRTLFFHNLPLVLGKSGRTYLTHAAWFQESLLSAIPVKLTKVMKKASDVSPELDLSRWGWPSGESIFPILELTLC